MLRVFVRRSQAYASNTHIFLVWMVGTSLVLLTIAIPFLRNQIRPILKLAEAAESFGKGRPMPRDFRPRGAEEVRRAGFAFIQMRERIERQIEQRTAMLTGVSHDLRTILTRFKLQLALAGAKRRHRWRSTRTSTTCSRCSKAISPSPAARRPRTPAASISNQFFEKLGRGGEAAQAQAVDHDAHRRPRRCMCGRTPSRGCCPTSSAMPSAMPGRSTSSANHTRGWLTVTIDDDGPGIPAEKREEVFKPFFRLDEARNLDSSGTGLGLAIARDIARSHGGDITLDDSPMGGLRAVIKVPA